MPPPEEHSWGVMKDLSKKYQPVPQAPQPLVQPPPRRPQSRMVSAIIRYSGGFVKEETHATYVLLAIMAVSVLFIIFIWKSFGSANNSGLSRDEIIRRQQFLPGMSASQPYAPTR